MTQIHHSYTGHHGIYTVVYHPNLIPKKCIDIIGDMHTDFIHVAKPFKDLKELDTFLGYVDWFSRSIKIPFAHQLPVYIEYVGFESYEFDYESLPPDISSTPHPIRNVEPAVNYGISQETYSINHRGSLVVVRRLSVSLFDPPESEVRDWLSSLAASPDFRKVLPSNWKALN